MVYACCISLLGVYCLVLCSLVMARIESRCVALWCCPSGGVFACVLCGLVWCCSFVCYKWVSCCCAVCVGVDCCFVVAMFDGIRVV